MKAFLTILMYLKFLVPNFHHLLKDLQLIPGLFLISNAQYTTWELQRVVKSSQHIQGGNDMELWNVYAFPHIHFMIQTLVSHVTLFLPYKESDIWSLKIQSSYDKSFENLFPLFEIASKAWK